MLQVAMKDIAIAQRYSDAVSYNKLLLAERCAATFPTNFIHSPFEYIELIRVLYEREETPNNKHMEIIRKSNELIEKYGCLTLNSFFFDWKRGFDVYNYGCSAEDSILNIEGIADAFSDFSTFNDNIMHLNIGYRVPSCNCGSQEDYNKNVVKFYDFLSDFYEKELKPEPDEDDWLDEDEV